MGRIAHDQRDFAAAEGWYLKSLVIKDKQGDKHGAASTYHQMGVTTQEQRDFAAAEGWYLKSLAIKDKQGDEHGAANTYHQLGRVAEERGDRSQAGTLFLKAFAIFARKKDEHSAGIALGGFTRLFRAASPADRERLQAMGHKALGDELMQQVRRPMDRTSG